MMDAVIDEVDGGMIRVGNKWLADFASCNYLGFDLDREIIDAIPAYLDAWGLHPSWSRLLGSPRLYEQIEERLTALLGSEDSLVLPTITHIHMSVIPLLAASGTIFLDQRAHKTIYDGCQIARSRGAAVKRFRFEDPEHLDELLRAERDTTRLVCMDGVNSMTGNAPDIREFAAVCRARAELCRHTMRVLDRLEELGVQTPNRSGYPIIEIPLSDHTRIGEVGRFLFHRGVYVTLAAYPLVPKVEVGFRAQLTAANTDEEVTMLIDAIDELAERGDLRRVDDDVLDKVEVAA